MKMPKMFSGDSGDQPKGNPIAQYVTEVKLYNTQTETWKNRREKIISRYKDERNNADDTATRFNVLWSITQTLIPTLFSRNPKPDIQRRFKDADPIGRVTSDILERCVTYFTDTDQFADVCRQASLDYCLVGRGTAWVRYNPTIVKDELQPTDDVEQGEGGDNEGPPVVERLAYEDVDVDYVHQGDYGYNICRSWQEVWLVWRIVYLTRAEMVTRFKEKGELPPLDHREENSKRQTVDDGLGKSTIYEAWDKSKNRAVWFHMEVPEFLDEREDPLKLKNFFPTPRPMFCNLANDSVIPVPDYLEYQDQARELDALTGRIASITKCLKVAGVYASDAQAISRLLSEGTENTLIAVEQWAMFAEKGGLRGVMEFLPLEAIANALTALYAARDKVKADLYEITGIADIIRGNSAAQETATAQMIKSSFATMRISDKQRDVQRFVREIIRIMVDIIGGHFSLDTIKKISGVRLLTAQEKALFMPFYGPQTSQPGQQPPNPMLGHNGGPLLALPPQGVQQGQMHPMAPPMLGQQGNSPQPLFHAGQQTPPGQMYAPPAQPGPQQQAMAALGPVAGMPAPLAIPPLPANVTRDQMETMLAEPTWEEVDALIRDEPLRCFRIDIETDSTIKADEQQDKADRVEFLKASGQFIEQASAASQQNPEMMPLFAQMLMFGVRGFRIGKDLEGAMNAAIAKMEKLAANPQQRPNPELMKIQGEKEIATAKLNGELQLEQTKLANKRAGEVAEAQSSQAIAQQENALEDARERDKLAREERITVHRITLETNASIKIAQINADAKLRAAMIAAGQTVAPPSPSPAPEGIQAA
jgi:hypothetical protein